MPLLFESGRMNSMPKKIDPALKERAVRLVLEHRAEYPTTTAAVAAVSKQVGVGKESLRRWVNQADVDSGERPGVTTSESAEIRKLKAEQEGELEVAGPNLARTLTELGLIDEYRIYLHPVVLGRGTPYFAGPRPRLRLVTHDRIDEDVIRLTYVPA